jgi:hypothetical protein
VVVVHGHGFDHLVDEDPTLDFFGASTGAGRRLVGVAVRRC